MQYEVDSYTLEYNENENKYYISFIDSARKECKLEIEKEIFDIYMKSKKAYIKIKNETSRHIEHLDLSEEQLYNRSISNIESTEDKVIKNMEKQKVNEALKELTDIQLRRMELHIINEITIRDLAKLEKVQKKQIQKSLELSFKKIKNFFEK